MDSVLCWSYWGNATVPTISVGVAFDICILGFMEIIQAKLSQLSLSRMRKLNSFHSHDSVYLKCTNGNNL